MRLRVITIYTPASALLAATVVFASPYSKQLESEHIAHASDHHRAIPLTTRAPAPDNFMAGTNFGDGTFYNAGLGSCGITNSDDQMFTAIGHAAFDAYPGATANPNLNPICNKQVRVTYGANTITIPITDRCSVCSRAADLQFSKAAFSALTNGNLGLGTIHQVAWTWA